MIKWNCNFNIPDAHTQLNECLIEVVDYVNGDGTSKASLKLTDISGETVVKEYEMEFEREFLSKQEIYQEILPEFEDAVIV